MGGAGARERTRRKRAVQRTLLAPCGPHPQSVPMLVTSAHARIRARRPRLLLEPCDFWAVLQKMGPDFDMSLGFWVVFCGCCAAPNLPTWGNAGAVQPFEPNPPAKPPRSCGWGIVRARRAFGCVGPAADCLRSPAHRLISRFAGVAIGYHSMCRVPFVFKVMRHIGTVSL